MMFVFCINVTDIIRFNLKIVLWLRCYKHLREGGVGNPLTDVPFLKSITAFKYNWQRGILIKLVVQIIRYIYIYIYRKLMYWLAKMEAQYSPQLCKQSIKGFPCWSPSTLVKSVIDSISDWHYIQEAQNIFFLYVLHFSV